MPKALVTFVDDFGDLLQPGDRVVAAPERMRVLERLGLVEPPTRREPVAEAEPTHRRRVPGVTLATSVAGQDQAEA